MKLKDVKIAIKVVPHSKSVWGSMEKSDTIINMKNLKQEYLYVARVDADGEVSLSEDSDTEGDLFLAKDFEPYKENRKYLTHDEVRNLPHGTKIKFTDKYRGRDWIQFGTINQNKKTIGGYKEEDISCCIWDFRSLEKYDIQAYIEESIKPKTQKETLELIFNGTDTIAILKHEDGKYRKGISKLHPLDTYNKTEGIRVAVAKAIGEPVEETKELKDYTLDELLEEIKRRTK